VDRKYLIAGGVAGVVLALDLVTKWWALQALTPGRTVEALGGLFPLTLAFNRGAAFGLTIGDDPRWIFIPVTFLAALFLAVLIYRAHSGDHLRILSASLVLGGALGNLYDRVRWDQGVVDFLGPLNLGFMHWPIFNVADSAITTGAVLLAISFWLEEEEAPEGTEGGKDLQVEEEPSAA
jgi:signal peptidase II